SLHQLDDEAFKIVEAILNSKTESVSCADLRFVLPDIDSATLEEVFAELQELKSHGQIFSDDELVTDLPKLPKGLKALCLNIAHDCNLACGYCFASQWDFGGKKALMPYEVAVKAVDMLIENSGTRRHLEIDFFGGEPLLNFEVIQDLVAYIRQREKETGKIFTLTLTTNAILLDDEKIA
ncbi:MAG TPA: 4Fe-4S cluster-binding domain-containing protein, partial [Bacillota bacterium]|nr:4Fe-4S cluster-binding domain-containing protein [Bacillota bacterium]